MAQYTVTHRCGHTSAYQLYGSSRERERKLTWLRDQVCMACKRQSASRSLLVAREDEIERHAQRAYDALLADPDPEQAIRHVEHQLAEGLGDEVMREAVRRAIDRYRMRQP